MNRQIYEEAASWLVEFRAEDVDAVARQRFERWLSLSPQHVQAYLELASIWEIAGAGEPASVEQAAALIERAKGSDNIVPLDASAQELVSSERDAGRRARRRPAFTGVLAAAASVVLAIIIGGAWLYTQRSTYTTAVGEQRSILLADGSTIELNGRSKVRVRYGETGRRIELLAGQAFFEVAKDRTRPFIVTSDQVQVRAVGTSFDVNQRSRATIVTVVEGTVAITAASARRDEGSATSPQEERLEPLLGKEGSAGAANVPNAVLLSAGEQVTLTSDAKLTAQQADIVTATAWTQRKLIFDDTPLEDVADEFNRHNKRRLIIRSKGLEDFHVSGGFSSSDPEPLLRFLRAQNGIVVVEEQDEIIVSRRR